MLLACGHIIQMLELSGEQRVCNNSCYNLFHAHPMRWSDWAMLWWLLQAKFANPPTLWLQFYYQYARAPTRRRECARHTLASNTPAINVYLSAVMRLQSCYTDCQVDSPHYFSISRILFSFRCRLAAQGLAFHFIISMVDAQWIHGGIWLRGIYRMLSALSAWTTAPPPHNRPSCRPIQMAITK